MLALFLASVISLEAPFGNYDITVPEFPDRDFNIVDYGAKAGEKCTDAIAQAMKACSEAGGGHVIVPKGAWLTGCVRFRSNCDLHFEEGAILEFTDDPADYPKVHTTWEGVECLNHSPLLFAYEVENVAITGNGLIEPRMDFWRTWFSRPPAHMYATECLYYWCSTNAPVANRDLMAIKGSNVRPHLIQFNRAKNVLLDGFRIKESPFWMIHLYHSENCVVRNLNTCAYGHNNDGVDVDMTKNVLIENCRFDQGDDGIVLKAGRNADAWRLNRCTENVVVRNCDLADAHSLLGIGSELSGGVRNVWMHDCKAVATFNALRIKTSPRRGGFVENIYLNDCMVKEVDNIVYLQTDYYVQWKKFPDFELRYTAISNINVSGISVKRANSALRLEGDWHKKPCGLHFKDLTLSTVRDKFVTIENCEDVTLDNVKLLSDDGKVSYAYCGLLPIEGYPAGKTAAHKTASEFVNSGVFRNYADGVYELDNGVKAIIEEHVETLLDQAEFKTDEEHDQLFALITPDVNDIFLYGEYKQISGCWCDGFVYIPAGMRVADALTHGFPHRIRQLRVLIPRASK